MAFTYDLSSADTTTLLISRLRLEIGDTVEGAGVRPDDSNFTDVELQSLLTRASNDVERAAAYACGILATTWATVVDTTVGARREAFSQVAKRYEQRAQRYADRLGMNAYAFSAGFLRADGYEADPTSGEYSS